MTTTSKVLLTVAGIVVLGVGAIAWKAYRWWQTDGRAYVAAMKDAGAEGRTFGQATDNAGCVDESLRRFPRDTSTMSGVLRGSTFVNSCLVASKPTPGFCDDVPPRGDRAASDAWIKKKCDVVDGKRAICMTMMASVRGYCHPRGADSI